MLKDTINPTIDLYKRAAEILGKVSFNLNIRSIDVGLTQMQTEYGLRPCWAILYQAEGVLIGSENYITQITVITDPFIIDEALLNALSAGCDLIRASRAQTMNGRIEK